MLSESGPESEAELEQQMRRRLQPRAAHVPAGPRAAQSKYVMSFQTVVKQRKTRTRVGEQAGRFRGSVWGHLSKGAVVEWTDVRGRA